MSFPDPGPRTLRRLHDERFDRLGIAVLQIGRVHLRFRTLLSGALVAILRDGTRKKKIKQIKKLKSALDLAWGGSRRARTQHGNSI